MPDLRGINVAEELTQRLLVEYTSDRLTRCGALRTSDVYHSAIAFCWSSREVRDGHTCACAHATTIGAAPPSHLASLNDSPCPTLSPARSQIVSWQRLALRMTAWTIVHSREAPIDCALIQQNIVDEKTSRESSEHEGPSEDYAGAIQLIDVWKPCLEGEGGLLGKATELTQSSPLVKVDAVPSRCCAHAQHSARISANPNCDHSPSL